MADIAHVIAVAIGVLFIGSSLAKLLALDSDLSRFMATEFERYADVFPLRHFGYSIEPVLYRSIVGSVELPMGALLAFGRYPWARIAAFTLLVIMIGGAYTHIAVNDGIGGAAMPIVLAVLLLFILTRN